jgi:hypothetical protein
VKATVEVGGVRVGVIKKVRYRIDRFGLSGLSKWIPVKMFYPGPSWEPWFASEERGR